MGASTIRVCVSVRICMCVWVWTPAGTGARYNSKVVSIKPATTVIKICQEEGFDNKLNVKACMAWFSWENTNSSPQLGPHWCGVYQCLAWPTRLLTHQFLNSVRTPVLHHELLTLFWSFHGRRLLWQGWGKRSEELKVNLLPLWTVFFVLCVHRYTFDVLTRKSD